MSARFVIANTQRLSDLLGSLVRLAIKCVGKCVPVQDHRLVQVGVAHRTNGKGSLIFIPTLNETGDDLTGNEFAQEVSCVNAA